MPHKVCLNGKAIKPFLPQVPQRAREAGRRPSKALEKAWMTKLAPAQRRTPLRIDVFDIDGTITAEGHDTWYEVTTAKTSDPKRFDDAFATWQLNKAADPYAASRAMMQQGIDLLQEGVTGASIYDFVTQLTHELSHRGRVRQGALRAIGESLDADRLIVLATTSYLEAAQAFRDALPELRCLSSNALSRILVSGSEVDWTTRELLHFNMGDGKVAGIGRVLGLPAVVVPCLIDRAFGDDPFGNDAGILRHADRPFIVTTQKNQALDISHLGKRVRW